jgi:hypothetical protein
MATEKANPLPDRDEFALTTPLNPPLPPKKPPMPSARQRLREAKVRKVVAAQGSTPTPKQTVSASHYRRNLVISRQPPLRSKPAPAKLGPSVGDEPCVRTSILLSRISPIECTR